MYFKLSQFFFELDELKNRAYCRNKTRSYGSVMDYTGTRCCDIPAQYLVHTPVTCYTALKTLDLQKQKLVKVQKSFIQLQWQLISKKKKYKDS